MKDNSNKLMMILAIVIIVATVIGIVCYVLYQKTDFGKSKDVLFKKYIIQNVEYASNMLDISKDKEYISNILKKDYTEKTKVKVNYNDEEYNFDINGISNKQNKEMYSDINISCMNKDLMRLELLEKDNTYGIRFSDVVEQFVAIKNENINDFENSLGIESNVKIDNFNFVDFMDGIEFTEEEQSTLLKTYSKLFFQNLEKSNYSSQSKKVITLSNGQSVDTKAYTLTLSKNELDNIEKRILNNLKEDQIIISKLEKMDENINEAGFKDISFKRSVLDAIDNKLDSFEYTGQNDMKYNITVYQNKGTLVRTDIEYNDVKVLIDISKDNDEMKNVNVKYYNIVDNEEVLHIYNISKKITENGYNLDFVYKVGEKEFDATREMDGDNTKTTIAFKENDEEILNVDIDKNLTYKTEQVNLTENDKIIVLNDYSGSDKVAVISNLEGRVKEYLNSKQSEINSNILENTIKSMDVIIENLNNKHQDNESTEITKFNSLFELYKGEEVKADAVLELINTASKNMKEYKAVGNKIRIYLEKGNYTSGKEEEIKALINTKLTYIVSMGYNEAGEIETITLIPNEKN